MVGCSRGPRLDIESRMDALTEIGSNIGAEMGIKSREGVIEARVTVRDRPRVCSSASSGGGVLKDGWVLGGDGMVSSNGGVVIDEEDGGCGRGTSKLVDRFLG
jgi:hypothetical protein